MKAPWTLRIIMLDQPVRKDLVLRALVRVAFPHARIEGISTPIVALGLTRLGELDGSPGKPVELVFLILSPTHIPGMRVQVVALVSRVAKNRQLMESLAAAPLILLSLNRNLTKRRAT